MLLRNSKLVRKMLSHPTEAIAMNDNTAPGSSLHVPAPFPKPSAIGAPKAIAADANTAIDASRPMLSRLSGTSLALFTFFFVAVPAVAEAASSRTRYASDISAAPRHHPHQTTPSASCAYSSCESSRSNFGYGVGDNSRNQTW